MTLLNKILHFILISSQKYNIDETHGISHAMNVIQFADKILEEEKKTHAFLKEQERIIYVSAALHDMCDKKYMNEAEGITRINEFLDDKMSDTEANTIKNIITTMSYSTVKKQGFPELGEFQLAYHIVREADLLAAYDFDRCILFNMHKQFQENPTQEINFVNALQESEQLFRKRVLKHSKDKLFVTDYSKANYLPMHINSIKRIQDWKNILKKPFL
jgi:HD superfamily phosphodiesterase